jgi:acyl-CoA thioester hydrolase
MKIRVYYEDTDCGNVVYYANYLKYMERSRTEYLRERGVDLGRYHGQGILFAVAEAHVKYRQPARYDDLLDVESVLVQRTPVSLTFRTEIRRDDGALLATGDVKVACIGNDGRLSRAPKEMLAALD